jgi:Tol biopolymer transport system component
MCGVLFGCPQMTDDDFQSVINNVSSNGGRTTVTVSGNAGAGGSVDPGPGGASSEGGGPGGRDSGGGGSGGTAGSSGTGGEGAPLSTCNDGWMNGDETGIDCGGSCGKCACVGEFGEPELVSTGVGDGKFYGPGVSLDNRTLYFSNTSDDGDEDLFQSERADRSSTFAGAYSFGGINTTYLDGSPYVTPDGSTLYFFSNRPGGPGDRDLWTATRASTNVDFAVPELLANVNSSARDHFPWLAADRRSLFFASDRAGGDGGWDIWVAERSGTSGDFSAPRNVSELNTGGAEQGMTLSRDALTVIFMSNRGGGVGESDLWSATRLGGTGTFSTPVNLGQVNSSAEDDDPKLSNDGQELLFSSSRGGERRLWRALRTCD